MKNKIQYMDVIWIIYLLIMYLLPNIISGIHYFATIFIMIFTVINLKNKIQYNKKTIIYVITYFLFSLYAMLSILWCEQTVQTQKSTIIGMFEIVIMIYCMSLYIENNKKLERMSNIFVLCTFIVGIIYYLVSPISAWGTTGMGEKLAIHRNAAGYYFAFAGIINFFINCKKNKKSIWISILLFVFAIGTGSRKTIIHILLSFLIYSLIQSNLSKMLKYIVVTGIVTLLLYTATINIPFFNDLYLNRLGTIFSGENSTDSSTIVRALMRKQAINLFLEKPILGHGVSGFEIWLSSQTEFLIKWAINGMYSHCNYTELLANFGLIGFFLYYLPIIKTLANGFCVRKNRNNFLFLGVTLLSMFLILDYATISYYYRFYIFIVFLGISAIRLNNES